MPGITGLQQVTCRGSTSLGERVRWDILYLRKQSLIFDLWILLKTIWVVISGKGAR
jgi:lipopolysaccharide/colanic/teichoic acid biosynthesis glycosyltransferase